VRTRANGQITAPSAAAVIIPKMNQSVMWI
jgi:hypothetical protein